MGLEHAPQLETLIRIEGTLDQPASGVIFEGITFAEATWRQPSRSGHLDVEANFTTDAANLFSGDGWADAEVPSAAPDREAASGVGRGWP